MPRKKTPSTPKVKAKKETKSKGSSKPKTDPALTQAKKDFITRCVKFPSWGRDMKIMNAATQIIPDVEFWTKWVPPYEIKSILWFASPEGKSFLERQYLEFKRGKLISSLEKTETKAITLEPSKVSADREVSSPFRIKSLREHLSLWNIKKCPSKPELSNQPQT